MLECVAIAGYVLVHDLGGLGVNTASKVFRENMIAEQINDDIEIGVESFSDRQQRARDRAYDDYMNDFDGHWLTEDMVMPDIGCK